MGCRDVFEAHCSDGGHEAPAHAQNCPEDAYVRFFRVQPPGRCSESSARVTGPWAAYVRFRLCNLLRRRFRILLISEIGTPLTGR